MKSYLHYLHTRFKVLYINAFGYEGNYEGSMKVSEGKFSVFCYNTKYQ